MNKIVRQNYPASRLPSDLQEGLAPDDAVTVIVQKEETPPHRVMTLDEIFAARRPPYRSAADIDADVRAGREDMDA